MTTIDAALGAYVYPWDVVGDPGFTDRLRRIGADRAVLAAAYHTVRALTPLHPEHKVVTAGHSAVYYHPDPELWQDSKLRPAEASWAPDSFIAAAATLRGTGGDGPGLKVYAWVVLAHNQRLGTLHPEVCVTNAYGDRYPWALCICAPAVRQYSATLVAEIAARPNVDGMELESCGWYGFDHLHAHDKTSGVSLPPAEKEILSWCFCGACQSEYTAAGIDVANLRQAVRAALDAAFGRGPQVGLDDALGTVVRAVRARAADRYRVEVVDAIRRVNPQLPILLHTHPDPIRLGANPGADPAGLFGADLGAVLNCWGPLDDAVELVSSVAKRAPAGGVIAASLLGVRGMGGRTADLAEDGRALLAAGATELRLYHAGLAGPTDLDGLIAE
jgi:hypothetical protein